MPENHVTRGGFNRFEQCKVAPKGISGGAYETCCGMDDFPNVGVKKTNHNGCCGPYGFNRNVVYYVTLRNRVGKSLGWVFSQSEIKNKTSL